MRAKTLVTAFFALGLLAGQSAFCTAKGVGMWNYSTGFQEKVAGNLDDGTGNGSVVTKFWVVGHSLEQNSGTLATMYQLQSRGNGKYALWCDWSDPGVVGGLPQAAARSAFLYSVENGGRGQYLLLSTRICPALGSFNYDDLINGNSPAGPNVTMPVAIPKASVYRFEETDREAMSVGLTWDRQSSLNGFFDSLPASNLVTGVAVRYSFGVDAAPSHRTQDWLLAPGGFVSFQSGFDPGGVQLVLPKAPEGMKTFLALSLLFDNAVPVSNACQVAETAFVGEAMAPVVTDYPIFESVTAQKRQGGLVTVQWKMRDQSDTRLFVVMVESTLGGPPRQLGDLVPAVGGVTTKFTYGTFGRAADAKTVWVVAVSDRLKTWSRPVLVQ